MKNIYKSLFALASAAFLFSSCVKDAGQPLAPSVKLDASEISLAATSGEGTVTVSADGDWFVTAIDCDWISFAPSSGTGNGKIKITADDNVDEVYKEVQGPRSTVLSIVGSQGIASLTVKQQGEGGLDASRKYKKITKAEDFDASKGVLLVTTYNGKYNVPSVCSATSSSYQYIYGQEVEVVDETVSRPNASLAYTLVKLEDGKYAIKQQNGKYLKHSAGYDSFYAYDDIADAEHWDLSFDETGHAILDNGEGCFSQTIYKETVEYTGKVAKSEVADESYLPFIYIDSKAATDEVLVVPENVTVKAETTKAVISVTSNKTWKVRCHDSWITSFTTSGSGDGTIEVEFPANKSYEDTLKASFLVLGETTSATVTLIQNRFIPEFAISSSEVTVAADATAASFQVTANVPWTVENCEGVTIDPMSGNASATVNLAFEPNTGVEPVVRTIKLKADDQKLETKELSVTLTQKPASLKTLPYSESFATSVGDFTIKDVALPEGSTYVWKHSGSEKYGMKASAYFSKASHASESWLVSPAIDLSEQASAQVTYSVCAANGAAGAYDDVCYACVIEGETVTPLSLGFGASYGGKYAWVDGKIDLSAFAGKTIKFAFVYKSTASNCPTFEVKNVSFDVKTDTIADALKKAKNDPVNLKDVIVTLAYNKGFFVQDATGQMLVYVNKAHEYKKGDKVSVSGKLAAYSNQVQVASPVVTVVSSGNEVKYPEPVVVDAEAAAAFSKDNPGNQYSKMIVNLLADKNYEGTVKDGTTKVNVTYDSSLTAPEAGKSITVEGYVYGWYNKIYFYAVKCEEYKSEDPGKTPVEVILKGAVEYIETGKTENLLASTSSDAAIRYKSDKTDVATVDENGKITAVAAGKVNITAYVEETEKYAAAEAVCEVNVTPEGTIGAVFTYVGKYGIKGVSSAKTKDSETFVVNGYNFILAGDGANGCASYDGYLLFGKKGAYIQFPAIEGKTLKSVTITTGAGASTSVQAGIYEADGSAVVTGGEVITLNEKGKEFTYTLTGAKANAAYRLQVASNHNAQAQKLVLVYQ